MIAYDGKCATCDRVLMSITLGRAAHSFAPSDHGVGSLPARPWGTALRRSCSGLRLLFTVLWQASWCS